MHFSEEEAVEGKIFIGERGKMGSLVSLLAPPGVQGGIFVPV
jgi:hypothetical protein